MSVSSGSSDIDQDELDIVNALTSCPICFEQFEVPKVLPCQHTFCLECLSNHYEATNAKRPCGPVSNFPCPNCRKTCYVPNNGLKDLPTDFKVEQIHDLLRKIQENAEKKMQKAQKSTRPMSSADATMASVHIKSLSSVANASCAVCVCNGVVDKPAVNLCVQCCKHFCAQCSTNHRKNSLFSDHTVMSMSPSSTDAGVGWKCDAHQADMTYFCVQCSVPACMLCVTCTHDKHSVLSQKEAIEQVRMELRTASGDLARKAKDVDSLFDVLKKLKQEHVKAYNDATKIVKKAASDAENKIKESEKAALSALKASHEEKLKAIAGMEKLFHEQQKSAKNASGLLADLSGNVSVKQTLSEFASMKTRAQTEADRNCDIPTAAREFSVYKQDVSVNLGTIESKQFVVDEPKRSQTAAPAGTSSPKTSSTLALKFKEMGFRNKRNLPAVTESTSASGSSGVSESDTISIDSGDASTSEAIRNRSDTLQRQALVERLQRRLSSRMAVAPPPPPSQTATTSGTATSAVAQAARNAAIAPASPATVRQSVTATNRISSPAMTRHGTPPTIRPATVTTTAAASTNRPATSTTTTATTTPSRPATATTPVSPTITAPHAVFRPTYFPAPVVQPVAARPVSESFNCKSLWKNETLTRCRGCSFASGDIVACTDFNKAAREGLGRSRVSIFGPAEGTKWQLLRTVESLLIGEPWDICYYSPSLSLLVTDHGSNVSLKSVKVR